MSRTYRPWLTLVLLGLLSGLVFAQPQPPPPPPGQPTPEAIAAFVNGQPISELAVKRALKGVPAAKQAEVRGEMLNFLIDNMLIEQFLTSQSVAVDGKDVDARLTEVKQQLEKEKLGYQKVLDDMMLSEADLRKEIGSE